MMSAHAQGPTDRLAKAFTDLGRDATLDAANERLRQTSVQIVLPSGRELSETHQVASLLAVEVGLRAFPAGVRFVLERDHHCLTPWTGESERLSAALIATGAVLTSELEPTLPTIVVGDAVRVLAPGVPGVSAIPRGWAGGAVPLQSLTPRVYPGVLGAVLAGAIAVSEIFLAVHALEPRASMRACGISTWRPGLEWTDDEAAGPELMVLPGDVWLIGLGHLGQAAAWLLRALPYASPTETTIALQDTDRVAIENVGTSLLATSSTVSFRKTRVVDSSLRQAGFDTILIERRMDEHQRHQLGEPRFALAGLDSKQARRPLSKVGWDLLVDAGIGAGAHDFTQIIVQRLSATRSSELVFAGDDDDDAIEVPEDTADPCGVVQAAGEAVGSAFVGAATAAISIAEAVRPLHGGPGHDILSVDLRDPAGLRAAEAGESSVRWPRLAKARPMQEGA
jgi:hypothetical protein